jgi:hypothetical protein
MRLWSIGMKEINERKNRRGGGGEKLTRTWTHYDLLIRIWIAVLHWWLIRHRLMNLCWHHCNNQHHYVWIHVVCLWCYLAEESVRCSRSLRLARVGLSDSHSDEELLIIRSLWRCVDASVLVNETVHISSSPLFTVFFYGCCKKKALWP